MRFRSGSTNPVAILLVIGMMLSSAARSADAPGPQAAQNSLLSNGSFEEGKEALPDGWRKGTPIPGVEWIWDRSTGKSGKSSLCLKKTIPGSFPYGEITQVVARAAPDRVKVRAWVKAEQLTKATIDVQCMQLGQRWHKWAAYIGPTGPDILPIDHDWKLYEGVVDLPVMATELRIGLQIYGVGAVWFDEVHAEATTGGSVEVGLNTRPTSSEPPVNIAPTANLLEKIDREIRNPLPERQARGFDALVPFAYRNFAEDYTTYLEWYRRFKDVSEAEVIRENCTRFMKEIAEARGPERERLARFIQNHSHALFRDGVAMETAKAAGLLELATRWIKEKDVPSDVNRAAWTILMRLPPNQEYLRQVVLPIAQGKGPEETRHLALALLGQKENRWAVEPLLEILINTLDEEGEARFSGVAQALRTIGDQRAIPTMIAVLEVENTEATIYWIGHYGLAGLTGVPYHETHDGPWWRRWWENNKARLPEEVRTLSLPVLPKRRAAKAILPQVAPLVVKSDASLDELLAMTIRLVTAGDFEKLDVPLRRIAGKKDPRAIPTLIACLEAADNHETTSEVQDKVLVEMTGVPNDVAQDGAWWRRWWTRNRERYGLEVAKMEVPAAPHAFVPPPAEAAADPRVAWLRQHAAPIRSLAPDDEEFSDLMPLAKSIGNARIVQLGEQSHGDGATFLAKCRLVRFLHQTLGFDVLAWESGLYDCRRMENAVQSQEPLPEAIAQGVFPIWGASGHAKPVFEYARQTHATPRPLEMAGFDCQFSGKHSEGHFLRDLFRLLEKLEPGVHHAQAYANLRKMVQDATGGKYAPTSERRVRYRKTVQGLRSRLEASRPATTELKREVEFYAQALRNLATVEQMQTQPGTADPADINLRDRAMAENLVWLARKYYPGRKIIVWAASFHLMRNAPQVKVMDGSLDYARTVPMGQIVWQTLRKQVFTVGFTAYAGRYGNPFHSSQRLSEARKGTLEALFYATGKPALWLDLRHLPPKHWLRQPLVARPLGYSDMRSNWSAVFDAMIFTDVMFPSTEDGRVPIWAGTAFR
jgi:erythromycin esterase